MKLPPQSSPILQTSIGGRAGDYKLQKEPSSMAYITTVPIPITSTA